MIKKYKKVQLLNMSFFVHTHIAFGLSVHNFKVKINSKSSNKHVTSGQLSPVLTKL